eukprot:4225048-Amphidinium_carterae.1
MYVEQQISMISDTSYVNPFHAPRGDAVPLGVAVTQRQVLVALKLVPETKKKHLRPWHLVATLARLSSFCGATGRAGRLGCSFASNAYFDPDGSGCCCAAEAETKTQSKSAVVIRN